MGTITQAIRRLTTLTSWQKPPVRWPGGEPPRAARTARARHAGCSSLLPLRVGRGSRRAASRGRHV